MKTIRHLMNYIKQVVLLNFAKISLNLDSLKIIKIGGNVIDDSDTLRRFLQIFSIIPDFKILVHGGGKTATKIAENLGLKPQLIEGRRITDATMRDVVSMVYGGLINKNIVAGLQKLSVNAIGLTGADGNAVLAHKREVKDIDYGFVGDIDKVNSDLISNLLNLGLIPVFAPLTYDLLGNILNTNADTQAAEIAKAMSRVFEVTLVYCFEKEGVLKNPDDENSVIPLLTPEVYSEFKAQKIIHSGMIPKLDNAFSALNEGLDSVVICHADKLSEALNKKSGTILRLN